MRTASEQNQKAAHVAPKAADAGFPSKQRSLQSIQCDDKARFVSPPKRDKTDRGVTASPTQDLAAFFRSKYGRGDGSRGGGTDGFGMRGIIEFDVGMRRKRQRAPRQLVQAPSFPCCSRRCVAVASCIVHARRFVVGIRSDIGFVAVVVFRVTRGCVFEEQLLFLDALKRPIINIAITLSISEISEI